MRRKLFLILVLSCIFLGSVSFTYAYLTDEKLAMNTISPTDNRIRIEEDFDPPDEIKPGTVISKSPRIVNDSEIGVYVRMAVYFSDSDAEKVCEPLQIREGWELHTDGYYYYVNILESGEYTASLFDEVKIRGEISEQELIPFDITVYAESVPASGYENAQLAWKSYTGGDV